MDWICGSDLGMVRVMGKFQVELLCRISPSTDRDSKGGRGGGGHEERFSKDPLPVFPVGRPSWVGPAWAGMSARSWCLSSMSSADRWGGGERGGRSSSHEMMCDYEVTGVWLHIQWKMSHRRWNWSSFHLTIVRAIKRKRTRIWRRQKRLLPANESNPPPIPFSPLSYAHARAHTHTRTLA